MKNTSVAFVAAALALVASTCAAPIDLTPRDEAVALVEQALQSRTSMLQNLNLLGHGTFDSISRSLDAVPSVWNRLVNPHGVEETRLITEPRRLKHTHDRVGSPSQPLLVRLQKLEPKGTSEGAMVEDHEIRLSGANKQVQTGHRSYGTFVA